MRLRRVAGAFDHPDWIFEPKMDGFRALAQIEGHRCTLVSRNGHAFRSWPALAEEIAHAVRARSGVIDGEICCLNPDGTSNFTDLLFRREWPFFLAFDVLVLAGEDLRGRPLLERKRRLRDVMPRTESRVRYIDHIRARGLDLFEAACERDLEGIVCKWAAGTYASDGRTTSWLKVKNPAYTQMEGRGELFDRRAVEGRRRRAPRLPELALR